MNLKLITVINCIIVLYSIQNPVAAQNRDRIWVFGDSVGIDFNNISSPVSFNVNFLSGLDENYACISTNQGQLKFYIGAGGLASTQTFINYHSAIYNVSGNIIPNGDSISSDRSRTQGTLFLPFPTDSQKYILLYTSYNGTNSSEIPGLYSAIIQDDSTGGRCLSKGDILIIDSLTEKLSAVRHANGRDWWILAHRASSPYSHSNTNTFVEILLTDSGFLGPFTQDIGTFYQWNPASGYQGQLIFSPTGDKLGVVGTGLYPNGISDLFDFDRCSGIISNWVQLCNCTYSEYGFYGCSFSPDGTKFYTSYRDSLFQFDLSSGNIPSSRVIVWSDQNDSSKIMGHMLGPDGKIYIASVYGNSNSTTYNNFNMNLSVINTPDSLGLACNLIPYSFYLGGKRCFLDLPNMPNYNLGALEGSPCDTLSVSSRAGWPPKQEIDVFPNPNNGEFAIKIINNRGEKLCVKIFNLLGQEVNYEKKSFSNSENKIFIKTNLKPGIYYLQSISKDGVQSNAKFIITKE